MAPVLGYWNIRGYGQPIRLMLAYKEVEYEQKLYHYGPPPEFDRSNWFKVKFTLGLDFPNLPYYIDKDVKLTQSIGIMRYLARKHDLEPNNENGKIRADMLEQQAVDFRTGLDTICEMPDFEKLKVEYLKTLPAKLKPFSDFLGKRQWFTGDKVSYVDFLMYEVLDHHRIFAPDCLNDHQNLKNFLDRIENLPTIQKYMKSKNFIKWPLNGDTAKFGSRSSKQ